VAGPQTIALSAPGGPRLAALVWAAPPGAPGVLIVPGLSSRKENHVDFGAALAAAGMAALALDMRGHGDSEGSLDAGVIDDVVAGLGELAARGHTRLGVRGSSMGGLLALNAADRDRRVRAVVAICPARPDGLARLLDDPWPFAFDPEGVVQTRDGVARGYWHAMGDERVPWSSTLALAGLTADPVRLRIAPRGDHGSLQHDPAVVVATIAFLTEYLAAR
jgi:uncharacterized protein